MWASGRMAQQLTASAKESTTTKTKTNNKRSKEPRRARQRFVLIGRRSQLNVQSKCNYRIRFVLSSTKCAYACVRVCMCACVRVRFTVGPKARASEQCWLPSAHAWVWTATTMTTPCHMYVCVRARMRACVSAIQWQTYCSCLCVA